MERRIILTDDGSTSLHVEGLNEQYHSRHGALRESSHVFIKNGYNYLDKEHISILEMGLGTGLNVLLTFLEAEKQNKTIVYTALEKYPITAEEVALLNFPALLRILNAEEILHAIHRAPWNTSYKLGPQFRLTKIKTDFRDYTIQEQFDLIYFDAFGPEVQPSLWTEAVLQAMYDSLHPGGILVTYSAKGSIRRILEKLGFSVERLQGPPGKRHMVRALKSS